MAELLLENTRMIWKCHFTSFVIHLHESFCLRMVNNTKCVLLYKFLILLSSTESSKMYCVTKFVFNPPKWIKIQGDNFESLILFFYSFESPDLCLFKAPLAFSACVTVADFGKCFPLHLDFSCMRQGLFWCLSDNAINHQWQTITNL